MLNELPRFHGTNGKPLNDAARRLVEGRLVGAHSRGSPNASGLAVRATYPLGPPEGTGAADQVSRVRITQGTWKYVLLQAKAEDWRGGTSLLVRNQAALSYHAEMVNGARTELSALGLKELRVVGGGHFAHDAAAQTISVYGFSKTYFTDGAKRATDWRPTSSGVRLRSCAFSSTLHVTLPPRVLEWSHARRSVISPTTVPAGPRANRAPSREDDRVGGGRSRRRKVAPAPVGVAQPVGGRAAPARHTMGRPSARAAGCGQHLGFVDEN